MPASRMQPPPCTSCRPLSPRVRRVKDRARDRPPRDRRSPPRNRRAAATRRAVASPRQRSHCVRACTLRRAARAPVRLAPHIARWLDRSAPHRRLPPSSRVHPRRPSCPALRSARARPTLHRRAALRRRRAARAAPARSAAGEVIDGRQAIEHSRQNGRIAARPQISAPSAPFARESALTLHASSSLQLLGSRTAPAGWIAPRPPAEQALATQATAPASINHVASFLEGVRQFDAHFLRRRRKLVGLAA